MPMWKPSGQVQESPAKWESNPDRTTFFLQTLVDAMKDEKFKNTPTVSTFNEIAKLFWLRYRVYHTPKQLKNYYTNRKAFWGNLCWALDRTGIGWDAEEKKILASEDWWLANETRKGLLALKDKAIIDYDLLATLFKGQHATTDYCYGPFQPIPLISDEGSGDSDNPEDGQFVDPQMQASNGDVSMNTSSGVKRRAPRVTNPPVKKKKEEKKKEEMEPKLSPYSSKQRKKMVQYFEVKKESKKELFESSGTILPTSGMGSINSNALINQCMKVMREVLKIDEESDLFYNGLNVLVETLDWQSVFLSLQNPSSQMRWLKRKVAEKFPETTQNEADGRGYDLNQTPTDVDF